MNFDLPGSLSEWAAMAVALIALAGGLLTLFDPRRIMAWTGLALAPGRGFGLSEIRGALGGFYVGTALFIIFSQPRPYLLLSLAFGFFCFGRILSFVLDGVRSRENGFAIMGDATLAAIPALHASGWLLEIERAVFG